MSDKRGAVIEPAVAAYAAAIGDDALVLSERCNELITSSPTIEEDLAIANIGLDLLGQARSLLTYAGESEGNGRNEDDLAYIRTEDQFRNVQLVELSAGDFAVTMARLYLMSEYYCLLYDRLAASADERLAAIAAKALKEVTYHRSHAGDWVTRLGLGTTVSAAKLIGALAVAAPYVDELFERSWIAEDLLSDGVAVDPSLVREQWRKRVSRTLEEAGVSLPEPGWRATGGRWGHHSEHLGTMLAVMQSLHRAHPGAQW